MSSHRPEIGQSVLVCAEDACMCAFSLLFKYREAMVERGRWGKFFKLSASNRPSLVNPQQAVAVMSTGSALCLLASCQFLLSLSVFALHT